MVDLTDNGYAESSSSWRYRHESRASGSSSKATSSRVASALPSCQAATENRQVTSRQSTAQNQDDDSGAPELDDYMCALMLQMSLLTEERHEGQLGKASADSDAQIAIELMLKEAADVERSLTLARSLAACDALPEELFEELDQQDHVVHSDRELVARLEMGDDEAEHALEEATVRFQLVLDYFNWTAECCSCSGSGKQNYRAPCGHTYCLECAQSLFRHALSNRSFIPVRCCKVSFDSDLEQACLVDVDDRDKYLGLKNEIENPAPPVAELDLAASRLISEKGWRVCDRCGAVVERVSGCVHMTCLCRNEFCYTCMKVWQTCTCDIYPAEELNRILDERVGNDDPGVVRHRLQNVLRNYYQHDHDWDRQLPLGRLGSYVVFGQITSLITMYIL
ncbi:hypothetical protein BGZ75_003299 [Mortierella antarctica]|nr:hypothetical protein BGZ75_003299 [Mortierella antarctica]